MTNGPLLLALSLWTISFVPVHARKVVIAYVPNWIDLAAFSKTIDYNKITHLNIAFENPINDAGDLSFNPADAELIQRARAAGVKVLVSIGGGGDTPEDSVFQKRYFALLSDEHREEFIQKISAYLTLHKLDGLDVDIEGPTINKDYGKFIDGLATILKPQKMLLTAALSRGYGGKKVPDASLGQLDFVNVMAYDATGPWEPKKSGQHSSMSFAKDNVSYWLQRGVTKEKLVLGVPFYGYGFGRDFQKEGYTYAEILKHYPEAENRDEVGETIWCNSGPTIREKTEYVLKNDLAGIMIWSLEQDAPGDKSLLKVIDDSLKQ